MKNTLKKTRKAPASPSTANPKIVVLLSSRCNTRVKVGRRERTLSDLRRELKRELEGETLFGPPHQLFEVWINEDDGSGGQSLRTWEMCMDEVRKADIVLVIYNGDSGWANDPGGIGICHAELEAALAKSPDKVRIVRLDPLVACGEDDEGKKNRLFQDYVAGQNLPWRVAEKGDDLVRCCKEELYRAVLDLTRSGARGGRRGGFYLGDPLRWSHYDFREREEVMIETLCDELGRRPHAVAGDGCAYVQLPGGSVLFVCHAVPAAMSIPAAREMCAQPFLRDYEHRERLDAGHAGPLHLIACHRSVTESQVIKQLGFPDATIVAPPFGVYAADDIHKVQLVFLTNCRDETATRERVQGFFTWMQQSGEGLWVARRAAARKRIVAAIADELELEEESAKRPGAAANEARQHRASLRLQLPPGPADAARHGRRRRAGR